MNTLILKENVLTDNVLLLPENGNVFKGGYIAIVKEYSFQNTQSDKLNVRRFRTEKTLLKFLEEKYPMATLTHDNGKPIEAYKSDMYYCVHKPTRSLVESEPLGGIMFNTNPNKMTFKIKGAWENTLKYRTDKNDFEIINFVV